MFEVGDKVKVITDVYYYFRAGSIGVVDFVEGPRVVIVGGRTFYTEELELVSSNPNACSVCYTTLTSNIVNGKRVCCGCK